MKMLNSFVMMAVVALSLPAVAAEEKKSSRRVSLQKIQDGDSASLQQVGLWLGTIVLPQLLARQFKYLDTAVANLISAGGVTNLVGNIVDNSTAQEWGLNAVYLGSAFGLLRQEKVPVRKYVDKGLNYVSGTDAAKAKLEDDHAIGLEVNSFIAPVILAAAIKLVVENAPTLLASTQTTCPPCPPCATPAAPAAAQ